WAEQPAVPVRADLRRLRRDPGAELRPGRRRGQQFHGAGQSGHRAAAGQRFRRQPVAAAAAVRRFLAVQEPEQRTVPGRVRRRQQPRPAAGPVALQERPRHQPGLQPALTVCTARPGRQRRGAIPTEKKAMRTPTALRRKTGRLAMAAGTALVLAIPLLAPAASHAASSESLTVDLASTRGAATGVGEGFLYGISQDGTQPSDQLLQPLNITAYRG